MIILHLKEKESVLEQRPEFVQINTHQQLPRVRDFADSIYELVAARCMELENANNGSPSSGMDENEKTISASGEEPATSGAKKSRTVYAAIVQTEGFDLSKNKIICITSGKILDK